MVNHRNRFSISLQLLSVLALGSCALTANNSGPAPIDNQGVRHLKGDGPAIDYSREIIAATLPHTHKKQQEIAAVTPEIEGYSPVSYFTKNLAEKGNQQFMVEYKSKSYYLTTARQAEIFKQDPEKYVPLFGGFCPYSLTLGRQVAIDPTNFKIVGGVLLLFHKSEEMDGLKRWNKESNHQYLREQEMLERARNNLMRLDF